MVFFYKNCFSNSIDEITSKNTKFSKIPFGKDCPPKNANLRQNKLNVCENSRYNILFQNDMVVLKNTSILTIKKLIRLLQKQFGRILILDFS